MALFGKKKKKKQDGGEAPEERAARRPSRKGRRRAGADSMASVLNESVASEVLAQMRENPRFDITRHGVRTHVLWGVSADDIGGLSKTAAKDRSKGAIIESINSNRIHAVALPEILAANVLIIIPDEDTLDAADEFSLLADAPWHTFFANEETSKIDDDLSVEVTLADAIDVARGRRDIADLLQAKGYMPLMPDVNGNPGDSGPIDLFSDEPYADESRAPKPVGCHAVPMDDLDDVFDDDDFGSTQVSAPAQASRPEPPAVEEDMYIPDEPAMAEPEPEPEPEPAPDDYIPDEQDMAYAAPPAPEEPEEEPEPMGPESAEEQFRILQNVYSKGDLDITVDLEPFYQAFGQPSEAFAPFATDRGDSWLSEYLSQYSREANADITRTAAELQDRYRDVYLTMVTGLVSELAAYYDTSGRNGDTEYSQGYENLARARQEAIDKIDTGMDDVERKARADYERRRKTYSDQYAAEAARRFDQEHEGEVEGDVLRQRRMAIARVEADHDASVAMLDEHRRDEARKRYETCVTEIIQYLLDDFSKKAQPKIDAAYRRHSDKIRAYLEDNREADVTYASVLAEQQRQSNLADQTRDEWQRRLEDAMADNSRKLDAARQAYEEAHARYEADLAVAKEAADTASRAAAAERDRLNSQIESLTAKLSEADERADARSLARVREAEDRLARAESAVADERRRTSESRGTFIVGLILVFVLALCIGLLFGTYHGVSLANNAATGAMRVVDPAFLLP